MVTEPFHGVRVFQSPDDPVFVQLVSTATIGLLCAIASSDLPSGFAFNVPTVIRQPAQAASLPASVRQHLDSVFDQVTTDVVLVLVNAGADAAATTAAAVGDATQRTGMHAFLRAASLGMPVPKLLAAPGLTGPSAPDGILSIAMTTAGTGYGPGTSVVVSGGGTGAEFRPVYGTNGSITSIEVVKPGRGYQGALTVSITGAGTGAAATAAAGTVLNPVVAEALGVAEKLRAIFYADGPDGTTDQAVAARRLIGSRRVVYVDPKVLKSVDGVPVAQPASPIFAGLQAKMDRERGVAWAADNVIVNGIQGTNRPVDPTTEASYLVLEGVNTIVNFGDGFRAWGPMTCAVGTAWQFIPVVRVADMVNESIEASFRQFIGRPQSLGVLDQMVMAGQAVLAGLEADGVVLGGSEFGLSSAQSANDGIQGIVKFAMKYEPPAPIFDLRIMAYRNAVVAYELLYDAVSGRIDTGTAI